MKKIIFISHNASRTGAPIVLLYFLKWLKKENKGIVVDIVFLSGGELINDFLQVTDKCYDLQKIIAKKSFISKAYNFILKKAKIRSKGNETFIKNIVKNIAKNDYDVIYANTIVSVAFAAKLKEYSDKPNLKLIAHIHELEVTIKQYLPNFKEFIPQIDQFISDSNLVMQNLNDNWNVNPLKSQLIYPFSDREIPKRVENKHFFEVGACGLVSWRKGHDLFLQVANYIKNRHPNIKIKYTWIGQIPNALIENSIEADLEKANLKDTVFFVGEQKKPEDYYKNFDVLLVPSREEPFSLVCIEVGKIGIPIICFEKAVGAAELFQEGGGFIVPYLDIVSMAEKIILYYQDSEKKIKDGQMNKENFSMLTSEIMGKKILDCIESVL